MEATTTLETTAMGNATSTAAPLGHGRPAERNGDHASHRNKRNRPHDHSSRFKSDSKRSTAGAVPATLGL
jgi:hypothetical protein